VRNFKGECPHLLDDLRDTFERIEKDYTTAADSHAQPGYQRTIWKYECKSRDFKRGAVGAFRIIAYYQEATNTLFPLLLYFKPRTSMPAASQIDAALIEIIEVLKNPPDLKAPATCECCRAANEVAREEKYTDHQTDRFFVFALCVSCIAQLNLFKPRSSDFEAWLTEQLAIKGGVS